MVVFIDILVYVKYFPAVCGGLLIATVKLYNSMLELASDPLMRVNKTMCCSMITFHLNLDSILYMPIYNI